MSRLYIGDTFPSLPIQTLYNSASVTDELFGAKKTVLWCLRYIGCTVCRYDIHIAATRYSEVEAKGAKIVFMLQSNKDLLAEELKDVPLPFDIICDPEMKIYQKLGIQPASSVEELLGPDPAKLQAKGAAATALGFTHGKYEGDEMQLPAMFIVDAGGKVETAIYAENITGLPTLDELLAML